MKKKITNFFTEPEEIYLVKKNGDVILYDATQKTETTKIKNKMSSQGSNGKYIQIPAFKKAGMRFYEAKC